MEEAAAEESAAPFIMVTGTPGTEEAQYYIVCEKSVQLESKSFLDALIDLIAWYYTFDICYPKPVDAILLFVEIFVFHTVEAHAPQPAATARLINNLNKLSK